MWPIVFRVIQWAGVASIGYFANDAVTAAGQVTGIKTSPDSNTGQQKYPWWFALIVICLLAAIVAVILNIVTPKKYAKS